MSYVTCPHVEGMSRMLSGGAECGGGRRSSGEKEGRHRLCPARLLAAVPPLPAFQPEAHLPLPRPQILCGLVPQGPTWWYKLLSLLAMIWARPPGLSYLHHPPPGPFSNIAHARPMGRSGPLNMPCTFWPPCLGCSLLSS